MTWLNKTLQKIKFSSTDWVKCYTFDGVNYLLTPILTPLQVHNGFQREITCDRVRDDMNQT